MPDEKPGQRLVVVVGGGGFQQITGSKPTTRARWQSLVSLSWPQYSPGGLASVSSSARKRSTSPPGTATLRRMPGFEEITRHRDPDPAEDPWVNGPPAPETVTIAPYNPEWPRRYQALSTGIRTALRDVAWASSTPARHPSRGWRPRTSSTSTSQCRPPGRGRVCPRAPAPRLCPHRSRAVLP